MLGGGLGQLSKYPPPNFAGHFLKYLVNVHMYKLESLTKELAKHMAQLYNNCILYFHEIIDISVIEGWTNPTTTDSLAGWDICAAIIYRTFFKISS